MRSFCQLAVLALPLFGSVLAVPASQTKQSGQANSIYASAHDAFQDLLNALPEESLQAALSGLKDFKDGIFESHHHGVERVHESNPALATKLIVAAVQDLKKRQADATPSNNSTEPTPPPSSSQVPPPESSSRPPVVQSSNEPSSSAPPPPPPSSSNSPAPPPSSSTERPVVVPVTTTNTDGSTVTTSVLSQVTATVPVTVTRTNAQGQTVTSTEARPAIIQTTTNAQGQTVTTTTAARFQPTSGEVLTETDERGSVFLTTYTPGNGKISSVKLITTTGADGQPSVVTSYTYVDPDQPQQTGGQAQPSGKPSLQPNAAAPLNVQGAALKYGFIGALAFFV